MKTVLFIILCIPSLFALHLSPLDQRVSRVGRMVQDGDCVLFDWSGVSFEFQFYGTDLYAKIQESIENRYYLEIDGVARPPAVTNVNVTDYYLLASGLFKGRHTVYMYKMTEVIFGQVKFCGWDVSDKDAAFYPHHMESKRVMEVIGDSITAGFGNEGLNKSCAFSASTENNYLAYASVLSRIVGARLMTEAWSGIGMVRNYGYPQQLSPDPYVHHMTWLSDRMPTKYPYTLGTSTKYEWDFKIVPDLVIINLGANDFSTPPTPTYEQYSAGYHKFLGYLRSQYDIHPRYLCTCAHESYCKFVQAIVNEEVSAGHSDIFFAPASMDQLDPDHDLGCAWHPNTKADAKIALSLVDAVRTIMNW